MASRAHKPVVQPRADFYGDPHTTYPHFCRPPICPTCHALLVRPMTPDEENQHLPAFVGGDSRTFIVTIGFTRERDDT